MSGLGEQLKKLGSRLPAAVAAVFLIVVGAAGALVIRQHWGRDGGSDFFSAGASNRPPGEYLYLDSVRVSAYLSQLENGLSESELRTLSRTESAEVGTAGALVKAGGTLQSTHSQQATVTPTAASLFYRLESRLTDRGWLRSVDVDAPFAAFSAPLFGPEAAQEGQFVELKNCLLRLPAFARVYPGLRPKTPALPLTLLVGEVKGDHAELLFPIAYAALANEPSLFSTRLTVVGKLVRKVSPGLTYVDVVTKAAFTHSLASHKRLLKRLHLPPATLTRQFTAAVSVHGPGAVILPIAILK
jgi:hypothetical protein